MHVYCVFLCDYDKEERNVYRYNEENYSYLFDSFRENPVFTTFFHKYELNNENKTISRTHQVDNE